MDQQSIIDQLEARARMADLTIGEVCTQAGVHPTTFSRWRRSEKNPNPVGATIKSLAKLEAVLARIEGISVRAQEAA